MEFKSVTNGSHISHSLLLGLSKKTMITFIARGTTTMSCIISQIHSDSLFQTVLCLASK